MRFDEHGLEQRKATILAMLDRIGEAELSDVGAEDDERVVTALAHVPEAPPHDSLLIEYAEIYQRRRTGWELSEYAYELRQRPPPGRRAYHWHEPWAYHFHCLDPRSPEIDDHYRGYEVDVFEAHRAFLRLYAEDEIDCSGLHPLRP